MVGVMYGGGDVWWGWYGGMMYGGMMYGEDDDVCMVRMMYGGGDAWWG